jgi:hypothetical protein
MKALVLTALGAPPQVVETPDPVAKPGEVLVRVAAASVNAFDVGVAAGAAKAHMSYEFPAVIGSDLSGTIEAIGEDVEGFMIGERVFGMMGMKGAVHDGSFADLATPQAGSIAAAPDGLSDVDAGSLAVADYRVRPRRHLLAHTRRRPLDRTGLLRSAGIKDSYEVTNLGRSAFESAKNPPPAAPPFGFQPS